MASLFTNDASFQETKSITFTQGSGHVRICFVLIFKQADLSLSSQRQDPATRLHQAFTGDSFAELKVIKNSLEVKEVVEGTR